MRILYIDDEPTIREIVVLSLQLQPGLEVRTAASGREGVDMLERDAWRPDAIMLDVMMPGMDGPQTLLELRRSGLGACRVIFITARIMSSERARLMALGAAGVIAKPFDPLQLAAQVRSIVEGADELV